MPNSWPIRRHLFALVLALVFPTAILFVYSLQSNVRNSLAEASTITLSLSQIAAADAQRFVSDSGYLLAGLAQRPKVQALDPANCDDILRDFREFFPQFANIAIADREGRVVCSAIAQMRGKLASVAGASWLRQVERANQYVAGHAHIGPVTGKWVSVLAYPIQDQNKRFIGAIGLPIDLVRHQPLPGHANLPAGASIRIVEAGGTIIASSDDPKKWVGQAFPDRKLLDRMIAEKQGQTWELTRSGGAAYGFTQVAGTDWFVIASVPAAAILESTSVAAAKSGSVLLLLTLLGAILAYHLGRRIVLPIIGIAGAAKAVAAGDLNRRAQVAGPLEIEDVAEQFNTMLNVRQRTEEKYRNLLESASDAIVIVDAARRIVFSNAKAESMFGYSVEQLIGQPIELLVPERYRAGHVEHTTHYIAHPRARHMAPDSGLTGLRSDGTEFPIEVSLSPLMTEEGLIVSSIIRDISERKRYEEKLVHLAQFDALTGLPNRNLLRERLHQAIERAGREDGKVALVMLDLDRFKEINDTLGHQAGDRVLQAIAGRLAAALPEPRTVARLGGDEFVVMEKIGGESEILLLAETIQQAFSTPLTVSGRELFLSASLGITVFPDDGGDGETLLKNVDVAMYQAKQDGRDTYRFYAPEMDSRTAERLALENHLRRALPNNELLLHYQPQVDTRSGRVLGMEALVRWDHPQRGMVSPVEFIGIAEETGLIDAFGEWILRTACAQNKAWQDMGLPPVVMAVNISARQFRQKNLAHMVRTVLQETGLQPAWLELEITESMLMQRPEEAEQTLREIAATGVGIALDDFGTGYSSLAYLKRFPVRSLKIDRSFVRDIHIDPDDAAIVTAVISMAKSLGLGLVAEGVELREQLEYLASLDCDAYQGYYFSRPLPATAATALLMEQNRDAQMMARAD
jgi:diguanylate cyclase (GGDEF)-like protein/PAS domain S-box-containing protein